MGSFDFSDIFRKLYQHKNRSILFFFISLIYIWLQIAETSGNCVYDTLFCASSALCADNTIPSV